jgi:AcrR family transcriptional regulator
LTDAAMADPPSTSDRILDAVRTCLMEDGYARLSTRRIAAEAGVPLSQVHYHFGSKSGAVLALLASEDERRIRRQRDMFAAVDEPLWQRYERACDFLEDDIESGYVRILQEMFGAGYSDPEIADQVRGMIQGWQDALTELATEAQEKLGSLGPFTPAEIAALVGSSFLGSEAMLLVGFTRDQAPVRSALRRVGALIRTLEESAQETPP